MSTPEDVPLKFQTMSFVTLTRYLSGSGEEQTTFRRVISLLLQGMALHAVQGDTADFESFRNDFKHIQTKASEEVPAQELLVAAGAAVQALSDYNQRTTRFIHRQGVELQNMISMLAQTVITIGDVSQRSGQRLMEIEKQMEGASAIEDVQSLKLRLGECLTSLREEAGRQKSDAQSRAAAIERQLENSKDRVGSLLPLAEGTDILGSLRNQDLAEGIDTLTGLPNQAMAEAALHEAAQKPGPRYVVTAVANRIQAVNIRYGNAIGDQVIKALADSIRTHLSGQDLLFRWRGPALVGLIERHESMDGVWTDIRRISGQRLEKTFEVSGRQVLIPISAAWSVIELIPPAADATRSIQTFVAGQAVKDYA
jgi:diguanylate cyclase (GGDEF)-like protein